MSDVNLEKINLNLVPVLRALLRECSVSGAAAALGRSPSAVSETLSQLRVVLEDPLLVRVGGRLQLTPKAANLVAPLEELHKHLQTFFRSDNFDPTTSTRSFTIASSDLLIYELGSSMVRAIRRNAPKMSLHFVDIARGLTEKMAAREIDFVLLPEFAVDDLAPAPIKFKAMKEVRSKALINRNHPLALRNAVSLEDLKRYRHIAFQPDAVLLEGRRKMPAGEQVYEDNRHFDVAVTVSQFLTIPRLLENTDLVAVVPTNIADAAIHDSSLIALPLTYMATQCLFGIAWSPVYDSDDAHRWFRKILSEESQKADISHKNNVARLVI